MTKPIQPTHANYRAWFKHNLIDRIRELELNILEIQKDIKTEKIELKWRYKMVKLADIQNNHKEMKTMTIKVPLQYHEYIQENNISTMKLICVAIDELRSMENGE